jgi:hypothetical protein
VRGGQAGATIGLSQLGKGVARVVLDIRLALASLIMALAVAAWAYGVYCYVQMVRHRRPGVSGFTVIWPRQRLTATGAEYRRRALWSYAAVIALLVSALLLVRLPAGT